MQSYAIISFINFIGALLLGVTLLLYRFRSTQHRRLAYFNFSVAIWAFGYWQWQMAADPSVALFWIRVLTVGSVLIPTSFVIWILTFLNELNRFKNLVKIIIVQTILFVLLTPTSLMIQGVEPRLLFPYWPVPGSVYIIFALIHFFGLSSFGLIRILINSQKVTGINRQRLRIVVAGLLIGQICGLTNFPLWYNIPMEPIGNYLIIAYPLTISYAMLKYRFMDTRVVLEEAITRVVRTLLLLGLYLILVAAYSMYFHEPINLPGYIITATIAAILTVFINDNTNRPLHEFVDIHVFKKPPLSRQFKKLQEEITQSLNIEGLCKTLTSNLKNMLYVEKVSIAYTETENSKLEIVGKLIKKSHRKETKQLIDLLIKDPTIYIIDELKERVSDESIEERSRLSEIYNLLQKLNIAVCLPIPRKSSQPSLLLLSHKANNGAYSTQEIDMLDTLRYHLSNALENVVLYERELQFNDELKQRVEEATKELQDAYNKLKQVDKMKDYIIDISSHELRTPASIIKSYLWLVMQGKKGPINKEQAEALDRAFQSNERLLQIINDMLDVSRIEDGRLQFDYTEFDLIETVKDLVEELEVKAKEKGLSLKLKTKLTKLTMYSDKDKLDEILLNLISNAIKYTQEGGVTVCVDQKDDSVIIKVKDTGIGIRKEDMPKLFTKFFRTEQTLVEIPTAGGTGLGLFITKSIVESLKGKIQVKSQVHKGTTFTVTLPIKE